MQPSWKMCLQGSFMMICPVFVSKSTFLKVGLADRAISRGLTHLHLCNLVNELLLQFVVLDLHLLLVELEPLELGLLAYLAPLP